MTTTVSAYSISDKHPNWLVPCPFCERIHQHGSAPGHRVAHCGSHPKNPGSYVLKLAGKADDAMIKRVYGKGWREWKSVVAYWLRR